MERVCHDTDILHHTDSSNDDAMIWMLHMTRLNDLFGASFPGRMWGCLPDIFSVSLCLSVISLSLSSPVSACERDLDNQSHPLNLVEK